MIKRAILEIDSFDKIEKKVNEFPSEKNNRWLNVTKIFISNIKNLYKNKKIDEKKIEKIIERYGEYMKHDNLENRYINGEEIDEQKINQNIEAFVLKEHNLEELEDIFEDIDLNKNIVNQKLLEDYLADRDLFKRDIESGLLSSEVAKIYEAEILKKETTLSTNILSKEEVKVKQLKKMEDPKKFGFIEPILLSLIVGSLGTIYLCFLYLSI